MSRMNTRTKLRQRIMAIMRAAMEPMTIKRICELLKEEAEARGYKPANDYKVFELVAEFTAKGIFVREEPILDPEAAQYYNNREIRMLNYYMVHYTISPLLRLAMLADEGEPGVAT